MNATEPHVHFGHIHDGEPPLSDWSRAGWTRTEDMVIDKPADAHGPEFTLSGSTWTNGPLAIVLIYVPIDKLFAEMLAGAGFPVGDKELRTSTVALAHLATRYPVARFANIDDAAEAAELSMSVYDWGLFDPMKVGPELPAQIRRVGEVWVAAGVTSVFNPAAGCECMVLVREQSPKLNG